MMLRKLWCVAAAALAASAGADVTLEKSVALSFGEAQLVCKEPGPWRFATSVVREGDVDVVTVTLAAETPAVPPEFEFTFDVSGAGAYDVWTSPYQAGTTLYPSYWSQWRYSSQLAESLPLVSAFGHDTNVLTVVSSEALRKVLTRMAFDPKKDRLAAGFRYFTEPEAPLAAYSVKMRLDRRRTFWADAVSSGADWMARAGGHTPAVVPSAAYEPLYSTWYAFWQDVHADVLERELAAAAKLGMKTAILDDGWQKEESSKYYSKTGDWQPVASRFPDMKGHVARVHKLGLKYMLWLSVPYVGDESAAWSRFQGKFLHYDKGCGAGVLDPRFPEVREHLIATYERVIRDWGFDGLKLDFIDEFRIRGEGDPAVKENYAGRDIRSVPGATDRLMTDILARLRAIKPDVLVEFRQNYVGPAIRKYGNILRAADAPYDYRTNRKRIADLRLTSGNTAVHSDMLGWSPEETPEGASLPILNTIFSTVQYSMKLGKLPVEQQDVIRHWIDFARVHREALLHGSFEAHHAELGYPLLAGESTAERIVGVYADTTVAKTAANKPTILLNATTASALVVDFAADASVETFDCRGRRVGMQKVPRGLVRLAIPPSGYAAFLYNCGQ